MFAVRSPPICNEPLLLFVIAPLLVVPEVINVPLLETVAVVAMPLKVNEAPLLTDMVLPPKLYPSVAEPAATLKLVKPVIAELAVKLVVLSVIVPKELVPVVRLVPETKH